MPVPSETLILITPLPPEEVAERVSNSLKPYKGFELSPMAFVRNTQHIFGGSMEGNTFAIHRVQFRKSSKHPLLKGKILPNENGSRVEVEVFMNMGQKAVFKVIGLLMVFAIAVIFTFAPDMETGVIVAAMIAVSFPLVLLMTKGSVYSDLIMVEKELKKIIAHLESKLQKTT